MIAPYDALIAPSQTLGSTIADHSRIKDDVGSHNAERRCEAPEMPSMDHSIKIDLICKIFL